MDDVMIRPYSKNDCIERLLMTHYIARGFLDMFEDPYGALRYQIDSDIAAISTGKEAWCCVAEKNKGLAGFLMYYFHFTDDDELRTNGSAESFSYVMEYCRNQGIAGRLRQYSIEHLQQFKERGIHRLVSCVKKDNIFNIKVLEKAGFSRLYLESHDSWAYARNL